MFGVDIHVPLSAGLPLARTIIKAATVYIMIVTIRVIRVACSARKSFRSDMSYFLVRLTTVVASIINFEQKIFNLLLRN